MSSDKIKALTFALFLVGSMTYALARNPVEATQDSISKGHAIYKKNCQMCHGEKGAGDGPAARTLKHRPFNFTDKEKVEKVTDEEMFQVISKGEDPMPPFERKLNEADRWHVINFVKTLAGTGPSK